MADILEIRDVSLRFGGVRALANVSLAVRSGELFSIIGPNGAGKTSLVNCISGRYRPTEGRVIYKGGDITRRRPADCAKLGIGRTFQNLALFQHMSVLENIMVGSHHRLRNNFLTGSLIGWARGPRNWRIAAASLIVFSRREPVSTSLEDAPLGGIARGSGGDVVTLPG